MNRALQFALKSTPPPQKLSVALDLLRELLEWTTKEGWQSFKKLADRGELDELLQAVNAYRIRAGGLPISNIHSAVLKNDLARFAQSGALRLSLALQTFPAPARIRETRRWIADPDFNHLCERTPFVDECIDRMLGMNERQLKNELSGRIPARYRWEENSLDRTPEDLFTPYQALLALFKVLKLRPGQLVVDLGSGLGRMGVLLGMVQPKVKFLGLELVAERTAQAQQVAQELKLPKAIRFETVDLSKLTEFPVADCYFMFNPFSAPTFRKVLNHLRGAAVKNPRLSVAIVKVGRPASRLSKESWLKRTWSSEPFKGWEGIGLEVYRLAKR